jgi:predicted DNA repair protein MutK
LAPRGLTAAELEKLEKKKISGAIKTDFVLSTEIIVIALGSLPLDVSLALRAAILAAVGLLMTGGVYGIVALIVKLDDIGYWLVRKRPNSKAWRPLGNSLVLAAPALMKFLSLAGTAAMFMVGGGILAHGLPRLGHFLGSLPVWAPLLDALFGLLAGAVIHPLLEGLGHLAGKAKKARGPRA